MNETELAAKMWRDLMADVSAQPCNCPDLRDHIWDWLRGKKLDAQEAHRRLLEQASKTMPAHNTLPVQE